MPPRSREAAMKPDANRIRQLQRRIANECGSLRSQAGGEA